MSIRESVISIIFFALALHTFSQENEHHFAGAIRDFNAIDNLPPPDKGAILFIGSSSFTLWNNLQECFPGFEIINRAFGGSTLMDQIHFAADIIVPYLPRQIVIYCGENDLAFDEDLSTSQLAGRFISLFSLIRSELPDTPITYISMKPSPSRWHLAERFKDGNRVIQIFLEHQPNSAFINIWDSMLDSSGKPDTSLFLSDRLHMNERGYSVWIQNLENELIK